MKKLASKNFSGQKGFTLIELVVVIVILGILAATAAPKFIDLTGDAKASVMQGVKGSMESAVSMLHAKAIVEGKTASGGTTVEVNGVFYRIRYGYPDAAGLGAKDGTSATNAFGIVGLLDINPEDFTITDTSPARIQHKSATGTACRLTYTRSAGPNLRPVIDSSTLDAC